MSHQVRLKIGEEELVLETGGMAKQANGAVLAQYGETVVLATVCTSVQERAEGDFVPLSVDYNEKYYAAGKIPGGFIKREGRPKDREILVSRLIDRPMRPLFSKKFRREIQVIPTTISTDQINPPDIVAMNAASAAVVLSDIPFAGPVGAVRVGFLDGRFVINPTYDQIEKIDLEIIVAGTEQGITMVEGGAREVSESLMVQAMVEAEKAIKELCRIQRELAAAAGRPKVEIPPDDDGQALAVRDELLDWARPRMQEACFVKGKTNRSAAIQQIHQEARQMFQERIPEENLRLVDALLEELESQIVRQSILERKIRTDGRGPKDIRPITCQIDVLPRTHGSALFTRGETQALVVTTLGTVYDEQVMDDIEGDNRKAFMLHYNFPPYSVGETGRLGTGRREIGHGHLAERSIRAMLPQYESFPYTIRVVSEILESNGSSSMASVCGATLSLLNAGVPIGKSVAGIAMGLVTDGDRFVVLSDILGEEDHLGDMDFKVAGTSAGITGFQMDIKVQGLSAAILSEALEQAREGRLKILSIMGETIKEPRGDISEYAPKIITMQIAQDKIGTVIGPGGKMIKGITEKTKATINIDDNGTVTIYCKDKSGAEAAQEMISSLVEEPEVGKWYTGTVKRLMDFGAFVEFLPGKEGLVHISRMAPERVRAVSDVVNEGQEVKVKLVEIDKLGRMNLSMVEESMLRDRGPGGDGSEGQRRERGERGERDRGDRPFHRSRRDRDDRNRDDRNRDDRSRGERGEWDRGRGGHARGHERGGPERGGHDRDRDRGDRDTRRPGSPDHRRED